MYFFPCNLFIAGHKANISASCVFYFHYIFFFQWESLPLFCNRKAQSQLPVETNSSATEASSLPGNIDKINLWFLVADCGRCELNSHISSSLAKHETTSIRLIIIITPRTLEFEQYVFILPLQDD